MTKQTLSLFPILLILANELASMNEEITKQEEKYTFKSSKKVDAEISYSRKLNKKELKIADYFIDLFSSDVTSYNQEDYTSYTFDENCSKEIVDLIADYFESCSNVELNDRVTDKILESSDIITIYHQANLFGIKLLLKKLDQKMASFILGTEITDIITDSQPIHEIDDCTYEEFITYLNNLCAGRLNKIFPALDESHSFSVDKSEKEKIEDRLNILWKIKINIDAKNNFFKACKNGDVSSAFEIIDQQLATTQKYIFDQLNENDYRSASDDCIIVLSHDELFHIKKVSYQNLKQSECEAIPLIINNKMMFWRMVDFDNRDIFLTMSNVINWLSQSSHDQNFFEYKNPDLHYYLYQQAAKLEIPELLNNLEANIDSFFDYQTLSREIKHLETSEIKLVNLVIKSLLKKDPRMALIIAGYHMKYLMPYIREQCLDLIVDYMISDPQFVLSLIRNDGNPLNFYHFQEKSTGQYWETQGIKQKYNFLTFAPYYVIATTSDCGVELKQKFSERFNLFCSQSIKQIQKKLKKKSNNTLTFKLWQEQHLDDWNPCTIL